MKIDHHLHTSRHSPDSVIEPEELVRQAREVGLDGVVITEHDYQWHPDELSDLAERAQGLLVLSGVEVSAREGHFLVYGLPDLGEVEPGIPLAELLRVVRGYRAAIVAAHPYRWEQDFDTIVRDHGASFDALEFASKNITSATQAKTAALLSRHPMGSTGSSDGHAPEEVGCFHTEFEASITCLADFVAALRGRSYRPGRGREVQMSSGRWI